MMPPVGGTTPWGAAIMSTGKKSDEGFRPEYLLPMLHAHNSALSNCSQGSPAGVAPPPLLRSPSRISSNSAKPSSLHLHCVRGRRSMLALRAATAFSTSEARLPRLRRWLLQPGAAPPERHHQRASTQSSHLLLTATSSRCSTTSRQPHYLPAVPPPYAWPPHHLLGS